LKRTAPVVWHGLGLRVGTFSAVHRIYLDEDGNKAPVARAKMALGPIAGGAVHLAEPDDELVIVEGVEDGLALMTCDPAARVWAAVGGPNMEPLNLPGRVRRVRVADRDPSGAGLAYARALSTKLHREGRAVSVYLPRQGAKDVNDMRLASAGVGLW
jgi:hypothetical protein